MDLRKVASLAVPGLPSLTGLAGMIFGILIITDCARFQTKAGECDAKFQTGALAVGLGLSGVVGSVGSFITKNPWIRNSAEDLMKTVLVKLDDVSISPPAPPLPPVQPIWDVSVTSHFEELTKDEIIDKVKTSFDLELNKKLSKGELIELATKLGQKIITNPSSNLT